MLFRSTGAADSDPRPALNTTESTRVKKCASPARKPLKAEDVTDTAQTVNRVSRLIFFVL